MFLHFSFTVGGAERLTVDLCNRMIKEGHQVHVCVINHHYSEELLQRLSPGIKVCKMGRIRGSGSIIPYMWRIHHYIREQQIEIVHTDGPDATIMALLSKCLLSSVHVFQSVHACGELSACPKWKLKVIRRICTALIGVSGSVAREIEAVGIPEQRIRLVYNGTEMQRFPYRGKQRERIDAQGRIVIGLTARLDIMTKGQDVLTEAVIRLRDKYPEMELRFAGDVFPPQEQELLQLKKRIKTMGMDSRIRFLGDISDIPSFLQELDLFVFPSRSESFGIALIEAMAVGVPCIASMAEGPAEIMEGGRLGSLFPVGDVRALADAIEDMISQYGEIDTKAISDTVRERYDIGHTVENLLSIYKSFSEKRRI